MGKRFEMQILRKRGLMYEFQTDVEVSCYDTPKDIDFTTQNITIKWNLELDIRNWGVKDCSIAVPDQVITLIFERWNEEEDSWEDFEKEVQLKDIKIDCGDAENIGNIMICPSELEIDESGATLRF